MIVIPKRLMVVSIVALTYILAMLAFFNVSPSAGRAFLAVPVLLLFPGYVILSLVGAQPARTAEKFLLSVGMSIMYLLLVSSAWNFLGPVLGVARPLDRIPLVSAITVPLLLLVVLVELRRKPLTVRFDPFVLSTSNALIILIPIVTLLLGMLGTILLNEGQTNIFVLLTLFAIGAYVIFVTALHKRLSDSVYPVSIGIVALTLLFIMSLRSNYVIGWDVNIEYQMYRITAGAGHWTMANNPGDPYYAMLSITILPSVLQAFSGIPAHYLFKVFYPLIACLIPVAILVLFQRFGSSIIAFLATFFILAQPQFWTELPALTRQIVSLFFFSLVLLIIFSDDIQRKQRVWLGGAFGLGMILSHYSTTYIAVSLLAGTLAAMWFYRTTALVKPFRWIYEKLRIQEKNDPLQRDSKRVLPLIVLALVIGTVVWYGVVTETANSLIDVSKSIGSNINRILDDDLKSDSARRAVWDIGFSSDYTEEEVSSYITVISSAAQQSSDPVYKNSDTGIEQRRMSTNPIKSYTAARIVTTIHEIIKKSVKVMLLLGILGLVFVEFRKGTIDREFIILSGGCMLLIAAMVFLPLVSVFYNLSRLYLQTLFIIAFAAVYGILLLSRIIPQRYALLACAAIIVAYYLPYSGVTTELIGGRPPVYLSNHGPDYERFYVHDTDVAAIEWLNIQTQVDEPVFADTHAKLQVAAFGKPGQYVVDKVLPAAILQRAYVFANYKNVVEGVATHDARPVLNKDVINYEFPTGFLDQNKNKLYSNAYAEVYR